MTDDERQELLMNDFVRVPNIILQMQRVLKNGNTYACLQFIWCKTGGWGRNEDTIAYSQFINDKRYGTGLGEKTIRRAVEKLADLGVITMSPSFNNMHEFSVNVERIRELVGDEAWSKRPPLEDASMVNLTESPVILTERVVNLSDKHGQSDHHTRTTTQEPLHKNTNVVDDQEKPKPKPKPKKVNPVTDQANALIDYWNDNHGKGDKANVKHSVWIDTVKSRLKTFTEEEIRTAMQSVINSNWHQQNKQVLIKNAIDSNKRCEQAISKFNQTATAKTIDRSTDRLAVNNNWAGANKSNIVAPNTNIDDMLGEPT